MNITRPAIRYHGGKFRIAPWIIGHFPEHDLYVEPFGGAAGVLLRKARSRVEVYNDLDDEIVNFFEVLRLPDGPKRLATLCALTPFSRTEFRRCSEPCDDPMERARRLVARCQMGFGSNSHNLRNSNGFRTRDLNCTKSYAMEWCGIPGQILPIAERFAGVTIERLPALDLIQKYDAPGALFYIDPPYMDATRNDNGKGYRFEMNREDHRRLLWLANHCKGRFVISGYASSFYDDALPGWTREEKKTIACGQKNGVVRTEVIWTNF